MFYRIPFFLPSIVRYGAAALAVVTIGLSSCDRATLEQAISSDPQTADWQGQANPKLPDNFPTSLKYDRAQLLNAETKANQQVTTQWRSTDPIDTLTQFYQAKLQDSPWQTFEQQQRDDVLDLQASSAKLQATVTVPRQAAPRGTTYTIVYGPLPEAKPTPQSSPSPTDLNQVPSTLQSSVEAVLQLEAIADALQPNQPISRAQFARWLVAVNNRIYRDRPTRQIRLAVADAAVFADVPRDHPDFGAIQGLAESGYIPSSLTGDSAAKQFQPDAPLTRETLLLWKVPLDRQQSLPAATSQRVQELWGFKDAAQISPAALSAIAADHLNGELSNIRRLLGSTLLFQPKKTVTQAEAVASLWFIGQEGEDTTVPDRLRAERQSNGTPPE